MKKLLKVTVDVLKTYSREDLTKPFDKIVLRELGLDIEDFEEELFDFRLTGLIDLDLNGIESDRNVRRKNKQKILKKIFGRDFSDDYFDFIQDIVTKAFSIELDYILN